MKKVPVFILAIIVILSIVTHDNKSSEQTLTEEPKQETQVTSEYEPATEEPIIEQSMVDAFIEKYNTTAPTPITDAVEIDVTDRESGHYRTEFRLGAFKNSIAKTGKIGDTVIDIVNCGWENDELRIYVDESTLEQSVEIVKYAAPIMDADLSNEELQDVLNYISGDNPAYNDYFGKLGMIFYKTGKLMLKTD